MNCKKCGRPMGKKGYCANCEPKKAQQEPVKKNNKLWLIIGACALVLVLIIGACFLLCGDDAQEPSGEVTASGKRHVEIEIREYGTIKLELDADAAPITVDNFVSLAQSGFYDGVPFHRIIEGFMMQGGDPLGNGYGDSGTSIKGEFINNGVPNTLSHTRGAISMARSAKYDSASCQFFIVHEDASEHLDGDYAVFGYVTEGMDIVDRICTEATPMDNNGLIMVEQRPHIQTIKVEPIQ